MSLEIEQKKRLPLGERSGTAKRGETEGKVAAASVSQKKKKRKPFMLA